MSINSVNKELPKVTICVPVRNGAHTIQRTLDSLLNQDYPNCEVIVSDNCSDDDTAKIVNQYASKGVKYFLNPVLKKWGAENNWNHILTLAEGPFIALYHADDIYAPGMVRRQVDFLLKYPEASAVFVMTQMIDECDRPIKMGDIKLPQELKNKELFYFSDFLNYTLKYNTFVSVPTMMSTRKTIDRAGGFNWEKYATAADIDLYLRMARIGPIGVIDDILHQYRISDQQDSAQIFYQRTFLAHFFNVMDDYISMPDVVKIIRKDALFIYKMRRATDQIRCAINMLAQGRTAEARINLIKAFKFPYVLEAFKMLAYKRPHELVFFGLASFLLISSYLGFGTFSGQQTYKAFQKYLKFQRKPGHK